MKVISQYRVIGPHNYDKAMHVRKKTNANRKYRGFKWNDLFSLKNKICVNN